MVLEDLCSDGRFHSAVIKVKEVTAHKTPVASAFKSLAKTWEKDVVTSNFSNFWFSLQQLVFLKKVPLASFKALLLAQQEETLFPDSDLAFCSGTSFTDFPLIIHSCSIKANPVLLSSIRMAMSTVSD